MSKSTQSNNKKSFCKVCKDAGKSEEEYTSHFVRATPDKNAPIVCPVLLSIECRFCRKNGHTESYCKDKAILKKREEKRVSNFEVAKEAPKAIATKKINGFRALCESDEEVVLKIEKKPKEIFPQLNPEAMKDVQQKKINAKTFADMARTPIVEEKERLEIEQASWLSTLKQFKSNKVASVTVPVIEPTMIPRKRLNWADEVSSSEDEDW
jgi:hypothetical protein